MSGLRTAEVGGRQGPKGPQPGPAGCAQSAASAASSASAGARKPGKPGSAARAERVPARCPAGDYDRLRSAGLEGFKIWDTRARAAIARRGTADLSRMGGHVAGVHLERLLNIETTLRHPWQSGPIHTRPGASTSSPKAPFLGDSFQVCPASRLVVPRDRVTNKQPGAVVFRMCSAVLLVFRV